MTGLSPFANSRDERGHDARSARTMPDTKAIYLRTSVVPAVVIAVLCVATAAFVLAGNTSAGTVRVVLAGVTGGVALMLIAAFVAASIASRQVTSQVRAARALAQRGQAEVQQMAERVLRGEQPVPLIPAPGPVPDDDPFTLLTHDLEQSQYVAGQTVLRVADRVVGGRSDQRVEIFVNLARRMQSLVHREIELLDDLEAKVEDPDLLKGLFTVDHLATRMRRQSESLAVLGGSASRRQWTRQVTMHEVLRAAIAEIEQYSRVKVVPPVEGVLRGSAVSDVIHLIAELVENATKFSAPRTTAMLRAQKVSAGIAIEVEDRGLGMRPADQQRMNALLADPGRIDIDELLRDGRIGLYVVSTLARRHGIRVQLQNNIYGGTQAVVVLPNVLLEMAEGDRELPRGEFGEDRELEPGLALAQAAGASGHAPPSARRTVSDSWPTETGGVQGGHGAGYVSVSSAASQEFAQPLASAPAERPPLPKRPVQASLTPQLLDRRRGELRDGSAARHAEPADQMTGLMADFLRGVSRSEEEDSPARD
jgi:signal transduction histidine kinase